MNWHDICAHPSLRDLPFKLETDHWGHIVMSPATNRHSRLQTLIARLLDRHLDDGEAFVECSIQTAAGIKVADVAWASAAFLRHHGDSDPYPAAPEILVEVLSPSNTPDEMERKRALYFAGGAREVWVCDTDGAMRFYDSQRALEHSGLVSAFPDRIELAF